MYSVFNVPHSPLLFKIFSKKRYKFLSLLGLNHFFPFNLFPIGKALTDYMWLYPVVTIPANHRLALYNLQNFSISDVTRIIDGNSTTGPVLYFRLHVLTMPLTIIIQIQI